VLNSKIDTLAAQLQAANTCTALRKFYAPADPKKDANGCVGVGYYDVNMATTSNINLTGGMVNSNGSNNGNYLGRFQNNHTNGYGVFGQGVNGGGAAGLSTSGNGVYGRSTTNWSGYFGDTGSSYGAYGYGTTTGLYGQSPFNALVANNTGSSQWTEIIQAAASPYGLAISNNAGNAMLCLNGSCVTALNGGYSWGGQFFQTFLNGHSDSCVTNPYTGGCSCPGGYSQQSSETGTSGGYTFFSTVCYK
jgi:hypothetical protein